MKSIRSAIENTVSITLFNKGLAGKILDEVKVSGAKVIMKNNSAEGVVLSPEEYLSIIDEINEMRTAVTAVERLHSTSVEELVSSEEFSSRTGLEIGFVNKSIGVDFE
ncbi:MAG: type II toxin-antitoxin system Phd/YefM family antitoxin [Clostridia bacterium]|nr:type II toxin-antitoxin system Phd/YefM family antitoxin [Clostridia bacterium]